MSDYTPRQLFADWYRNVEPEVTDEKVTARLAAIDEIFQETDDDFWLDIIRLFLGLTCENDENRGKFIDSFKKTDTTFPLIGNEALLKYLAGITLCISLNELDENNEMISLASITGSFFAKSTINQKVPVTKYAFDFIAGTIQSHKDRDKKLRDSPDTEMVNNLIESHLLLKQEVNVLWWIIGEFSKIKDCAFSDIGVAGMVLLGAKEFSDIMNTDLGSASYKAILNKMLIITNGGKAISKNVTGYSLILSLSIEERKLLLNSNENISNVTPMLIEVQNSVKYNNDEDWEKQSIDYLNKKLKPIEFCCQIYFEFLLLKLI